MSGFDITNKIFHDADAAREHLEAQRWPDGPQCPHCRERVKVTALTGKSHRKGLYQGKSCRKQFSVTVGTVFERSKIPLNKWVLATHLMTSSKKGMSAHQLHRILGVTYKTAWFMCHRIREAMGGTSPNGNGPIGGKNKVVESDETYVGGKARNVHKSKPIPKKHAVVTLVERDGDVRATHVPRVTAKNVRDHLVTKASRKSHLMTDEARIYVNTGKQFSGHSSVNHSAGEYVRLGSFVHVNTAESFHALLKRGIYGAFHAVSEQHLQRYVNEFAFRWNGRKLTDHERANEALKGIEGKRLTYRRTNETLHA